MYKQECIPVGCIRSAVMAILGGVSASGSRGIVHPLGRHPQADNSPRTQRQIPPTLGQTDTCKNTTFPQLLLQMAASDPAAGWGGGQET